METKEKFKKIKDADYSISNLGNLRNDLTSYILKPMKNKKTGYLHYQYRKTIDGKKKLVWDYAHRLVYEYFGGELYEGMEVDHIDNDRRNNRISNLRLLSVEDNREKLKDTQYSIFSNKPLKKISKRLYNLFEWNGTLVGKYTREEICEILNCPIGRINRMIDRGRGFVFIKNKETKLWDVFCQKELKIIESGKKYVIELKYDVSLREDRRVQYKPFVEKTLDKITKIIPNKKYKEGHIPPYLL
jgi:hypothetical protein